MKSFNVYKLRLLQLPRKWGTKVHLLNWDALWFETNNKKVNKPHLSSTQALHTSLHSPFSIKHFLTFIFSAHEHLNADVCATGKKLIRKYVYFLNFLYFILTFYK